MIHFSYKGNNSVRDGKPEIWPGGVVPYVVTNRDYSIRDRRMIERHFSNLETVTKGCVRFVRRRFEKDYIQVFNSGQGCFTFLGKLPGRTIMSLDDECLNRGTIKHEALHVLGFHHAQSRMDRDEYLEILYENIEEEEYPQFEKVDTHNELVPFDYHSIMLYPPFDFSKNDSPAMVARNSTIDLNFGRGDKLTESDIEMIKLLYKCK